jgi:hypothetical protein
MQCPYCLENVSSSAFVCKSCGRDLQLVTKLQAHVARLESKLSEVGLTAAATRREASLQLAPARSSYRLEAALALAAAALLPAALFDLYIGFHLPPAIPLFTTVLAAGAAGLLIGYHISPHRQTFVVLGILLAVLQVGGSSIAFGCVVHAYSLGLDRAGHIAGAAGLYARATSSKSTVAWFGDRWHDPHLWLSIGIPSLLLFVLLAFVGRSRAQKERRSPLAVCLGKRFTPRRPEEEHESFQIRLDAATKIFDGITHFLIVLIPLLSSLFVIARQASTLTATDPIVQSSANSSPAATASVPIQDTADK